MKFGQEYAAALAREDFPQHWLDSAIEYKQLKKCIKKVQRELDSIGLDAPTIDKLAQWLKVSDEHQTEGEKSKDGITEPNTIPDDFTPQLRVLVDSRTGTPLDATLAPETRANLEKLARSELLIAGRRAELGHTLDRVTELQTNGEADSASE